MKVIFLDVDGVLNFKGCKARCGYYLGVDDGKTHLLAKIVRKTGAKIVLVSTWKENWYPAQRKNEQDYMADYLDERLAAAGLFIYDKTPDVADGQYLGRGEGIVEYVHGHGVSGFAILDDCQFDYDACDLTDFWVATDERVGLTQANVDKAIDLIEKGWQ